MLGLCSHSLPSCFCTFVSTRRKVHIPVSYQWPLWLCWPERVERKMLSYVYIKLLHMLGFSLPVLNTIIVFITNVHFYKLRRKTCWQTQRQLISLKQASRLREELNIQGTTMTKNKIKKNNSLTDRHTRSNQAVLLVVLRKKNILEKEKNQCVSKHQKEDNSYGRQKQRRNHCHSWRWTVGCNETLRLTKTCERIFLKVWRLGLM